MSGPPLPQPVADFLDAEIFSIPQLEALLLVHDAGGEPCTPEQLAAAFYLPAGAFLPWLAAFAERGLLRADGDGYRALPAQDPRARAVTEVAACYAQRRVTVTRHVYAAKADPARRFAEAFRLRKDKGP